LLYKVFGIT